MTFNHLFLDADVLLDWLLNREPFAVYAKTLINECLIRQHKMSTSALIIANTNFVLSKNTNADISRQKIKTLVKLVNILPFESDIVNLALYSSFTDFEDSIQYFIADRYQCDVIITRNIKDYKTSTIPVLTAEQFLKTL